MKLKNKKVLVIVALSILSILLMPKKSLAVETICIWSEPIDRTAIYTGSETKIKIGAQDSKGNNLVEGVDYIVEYTNNIEMGIDTATATATGIGNWTGTHSVNYSIKGDIATATISGIENKVYTGKEITQNIEVKFQGKTLKENEDYNISYYSNKEVGYGYILVTGKGLYTGTYSGKFKIVPDSVKSVNANWKDKGIKVSWSQNSNVTGYQLYRSTSKNGTYKKIATINSNSTISYQDNSVESGKTYYYKIKTYKMVNNEEIRSPFSPIKTKVFMRKVELTITSYNDKAKLTWKKIENADAYQIFRATSKDGEYTRIRTISGSNNLTYYDKNVKTNKKYYYKVRAYTFINGQKSYGSFSTIQEKAELAKTTITSGKYSSSKNTIKWSKVSGVTGYKIYRATSKNGTYTKIKTIKNNTTFSYTDSNLSLGKVYYYKVRAYKVKSGKETHGQYSDIKKLVTGTAKQQLNKIKCIKQE